MRIWVQVKWNALFMMRWVQGASRCVRGVGSGALRRRLMIWKGNVGDG